jgi:hypothetical protein
MATNYLRGLHVRADDDTNTSGPIRFVASTEGVKRDGLEIKAESWELENYRKNPVVLWSHDYWGTHLPVGRADVNVEGKSLIASVTFDPDDEFARAIERKYRNGFLNTVSVGWDSRGDTNELLDISAVPVPGDPDALMERQIRGLASIGEKLIELTDEPDAPVGDDAEAVWQGTALRMARLFTSAADDAFDDREYRRLCRTYQRLGKTPPEVPGHLDKLGVAERRGLFLAGEPDLVPELFAVPTMVDEPATPDDALVRLHEIMMKGAK